MEIKIIKSIENTLAKGKMTIRQDTVRKAIERGEYEWIECAYHYTDDYAWDEAVNYGRGRVSAKAVLRDYSILKPSCWVREKMIDGKKYYEVVISFHSNLAYDMYIPA